MTHTGLVDRWLIVGDSIQAGVYADVGMGDPCALMASRLPSLVNISVYNLSAPGQRITQGGTPGFGASINKNAIGTIVGYYGAKGVIITLGTNDYSNPGSGLVEFIEGYRSLIAYCRSLGLIVVVISPIWRADCANVIHHADGGNYSMEVFRVYGEMMAAEEANKPGPAVHILSGISAPLHPEHYVADQIHLNGSGQSCWTNWVVNNMVSLGLWSLRPGA